MNKVWFCKEHPDDYEGYYIGHSDRNKAKALAANELGCDFTSVRMELIKGAETEVEGILPRAEIERITGTPTPEI